MGDGDREFGPEDKGEMLPLTKNLRILRSRQTLYNI